MPRIARHPNPRSVLEYTTESMIAYLRLAWPDVEIALHDPDGEGEQWRIRWGAPRASDRPLWENPDVPEWGSTIIAGTLREALIEAMPE